MTDGRDPGVGRLGMAAAWISAVCCLPYLVLKVVWTVGLPLGITDRSLLDSNDWVAGNALMALIELSALLLVFVRRGRVGRVGHRGCSERGEPLRVSRRRLYSSSSISPRA
jgi:hypothetical protein